MTLVIAWIVALALSILAVALGWRAHRLAQFDRAALDDIGHERYRYVTDADGRTDHRPELREQTLARRDRAEAARRHAAAVDSGGVRLEAVEGRKRA